jgi:Xaa-Pro aminopeptidase
MIDAELFQRNKVDAFVVFDPSNRLYLSGLKTSFGCSVITKKRKIYFTDFRYKSYAETALKDFELRIVTAGGLYGAVYEALTEDKVKNAGFEDDFLTVAEYKRFKAALPGLTLKPAGEVFSALRAVKTEEEIEKIRTAQRISEAAFQNVLNVSKPGMTERDIAAELNFALLKNGSEDVAFPSIVAAGENAAKPHHEPGGKIVEKNELVLFDFGAVSEGYRSDMSRTVCFGTPSKELERIHSLVLQAQTYALKNIKAGMTAGEADSFAREFLSANGFGANFGHSLGHGVGIDIHEHPRVGANSDTVLLPGMVITIEPGVYIEGLGGVRIEDICVVREDGLQNLTSFSKNLHV